MSPCHDGPVDSEPPGAFAGHLVRTLTGGALTMLISLGYRTGLFEAAAAGPATSAGLADRAGLQERYVREWLGAMVTGGFFRYDPVTREYALPAEHAHVLTGPGAANAGPMAAMLQAFAGALPELERCGGFLGAVPGGLAAGAAVLDLGCGTGHAVTVAARAFPASRFLGVDIDEHAVTTAQSRRARLGLGNAAFVIGDAAALPARPRFDVITAFDAVHDQRSPQEVLRRVRAALAPGGVFVMVDAKFSSHLAGNVGNPLAALCYAISLMYCTPVGLGGGGAGLGAMWGTELAGQMLAEAGFSRVEMLDSPRPQNCIYVCRT